MIIRNAKVTPTVLITNGNNPIQVARILCNPSSITVKATLNNSWRATRRSQFLRSMGNLRPSHSMAPTLYRALEAGRPVDTEAGGIAAYSLAPKRVGELM